MHGLDVTTLIEETVISATLVFSDEAVAEVNARLMDSDNYLNADEELTQPLGTDTLNWIFNNFTGV